MWSYLARRMLLMVVSFFGITLLTFVVLRAAPGLLGIAARGAGGELNAEMMQMIREQQIKLLGLDQPWWQRYPMWLGRSVTLDFGETRSGENVAERIKARMPVTIYLNLISFTLIYLITIPLGIYSATHQGTFLDKVLTLAVYALYSLPVIFVGLLLLLLVGRGGMWQWFPVGGINSLQADRLPFFPWLADRLWHFVLPVTCLTYGGLAFLARFQRNNMLETIRQDYVRTARAKGLDEHTVIYRHALRNALIPLITLFALLLPSLIGGSVVVEYIFSIDGMGKLFFDSVTAREINVVMALVTIAAVLTLIALLLQDVLYSLIDPRISLD